MSRFLSRGAGAPALVLVLLALAGCSGESLSEPSGAPQLGEPLADFSATPTQGIAPLEVMFTNLSNDSTAWLWDFGDGGLSTEQDPVHQYAAPGIYTVRLTAVGQGGSDVEEAIDLVQAEDAIGDASFEGQIPASPPGAPWQIVAGGAHVIQPVPGLFGDNGMPSGGTQWCEISGAGSAPGGVEVAGIEQAIQPPLGARVLQFEAAFINSENAASTSFNDFARVEVSDGATTQVLWARDTFSGSITTSALHGGLMTPVETVTADLQALFPGSGPQTPFVLRALVGNGGDSDVPSFAYLDALRFRAAAEQPIEADFSANLTTGGIGSLIAFSDDSSGAPSAWSWDFGDGSASTQQEPVHSYLEEGTYTVTLSAAAPGAGDVLVEQDFITIDNSQCEQGALQILSPPGACGATNEEFTFQNDSVNGTSYLWDFGDGTTFATASKEDVTHSFSAPGDYDVTVTAFGTCFGSGGNTSTPEVAEVVAPPTSGALDFSITFPFGTGVTCEPPGFGSFANEAAFKGETVRFTASNSNPGANPLTFSWTFGDGGSANGSQVDHVYTTATTGNVKRTVTLTATNCAGSAQVQKTIKIVQDWTTVYTYLNGGTSGSPTQCASCHNGNPGGGANGVMSLLTIGTAYNNLRNINMLNVCVGSPSKRVSTACGGSSNSDVSGLIWALSNNVCGNGNMASLCSCLNPVTNATQVNELSDWIDFGSPEN
jgi:PKD repeat protein